jgi:hypothetical protein
MNYHVGLDQSPPSLGCLTAVHKCQLSDMLLHQRNAQNRQCINQDSKRWH